MPAFQVLKSCSHLLKGKMISSRLIILLAIVFQVSLRMKGMNGKEQILPFY